MSRPSHTSDFLRCFSWRQRLVRATRSVGWIGVTGLLILGNLNGSLLIAAPPVVLIETVESPNPLRGTLQSLTGDVATVKLDTGNIVTERRDRLVAMKFLDTTMSQSQASSEDVNRPIEAAATDWLLFVNGDRWQVNNFRIVDGELSVLPTQSETVPSKKTDDTSVTPLTAAWVAVPLETLRGIVLSSASSQQRPRIERQIGRWADAADRLLLKNGDELSGELGDCGPTSLLFTTSVGDVTLERGQVAAIVFNTELLNPPATKTNFASLTLQDSSTLTLSNITYEKEADSLRMTTDAGVSLTISCSSVQGVDFYSSTVQPLDRLTPALVQGATFLGEPIRLTLNRNARDLPLTMGGATFPRGFGVVSRTEMTFSIDGDWREFQAFVGLDDAARQQGSVEFVVLGDDKELFRVTRKGNDPAISTGRLSIHKVKRLTLVVDYSDRADIQDLADWCRTVLIR
ncbi:MAG: NPCBM/NEW2 domain-containing protein [Planctomycetaceae bacterium]